MANELKAGDVVKLKSEKYNKMTIGEIDAVSGLAKCFFFDKNEAFQEITTPLITLQKTTPPA